MRIIKITTITTTKAEHIAPTIAPIITTMFSLPSDPPVGMNAFVIITSAVKIR